MVWGTWLWKERVMLDLGKEKVTAHGFTILLACLGRSGQGKGYCSAGKSLGLGDSGNNKPGVVSTQELLWLWRNSQLWYEVTKCDGKPGLSYLCHTRLPSVILP